MSFCRSVRIVAAVSGILAPAALQAQTADEVQAVWDYFAETCDAVVAADNPAVFATRLPESFGAAGQSADLALSIATVEVDGVAPEGDRAMLNAMVNVFEGGRSVQCMLQIPQPSVELTGLAQIARDQAADLLGGDVEVAGGGLSEIQMEDGFPEGIGESATYVRASRGGFPPDAVLMVQIMPVFVSLTLSVAQTDASE